MEKTNMHSLDMVNENIKKIGSLFPECITETFGEDGKVKAAIDFEKLQENLSHATIGEGEERYQFTWPGKREAIHNANAPTNMTLRPCKEESFDFDNTKNLYIEGDNLEVLKLLQENYLGKVKMIYIDPPYNTGNDFVYNDDFKEDKESFESGSGMYDEDGNMLLQNFEKNTESNGRFHTDWLNMMYPRLKIARNLLSDDGVIFISIDDSEVENLRKISDEIFGVKNFVAQFVWKKKQGGGNDSAYVVTEHEYVLCFAKSIDNFSLNLDKKYKLADALYPNHDEKGDYGLITLDKASIQFSPSLVYEITGPDGTIYTPRIVKGKQSCWRWGKKKVEELYDELVFKNGKVYTKYYRPEGVTPKSLLIDAVYGRTETGNDDISSLFEKNPFSYPKPVSLIHHFLEIGTKKNDLILDFFSGSATTAHAVMQLNAEDGGKRKYICVQLPEKTAEDSEAYKAGYKTICEIGKERIRRAGKKIRNEKLEVCNEVDNSSFLTSNSSLDVGFRVLKLAESNMKDVFYSPAETTGADIFDIDNVKEDRTPLDLLFQVMPECNLPLSSKIETRIVKGKTVYFVESNYLVACFDSGITDTLIKTLVNVEDCKKPYYFYMRNHGLESDKVLDNFEQLFIHYSPTTKRKVL